MDAGPLELRIAADGRDATVHLVGELDVSSADVLRQALCRLYHDGASSLVLDLSELAFVDSTGLSEFVIALKHCRGRGGDVVLRSPTPSATRVLNISGLDQVFTIVFASGASAGG